MVPEVQRGHIGGLTHPKLQRERDKSGTLIDNHKQLVVFNYICMCVGDCVCVCLMY